MLLVDGVRPIDALGTVDTLTVACPEPLTVTGELGDMLGDHVSQLGLACADADAHEPLGVTVPWPLELGVMAPDGDPVTVCPLHVIRGLDETVACADPVIPLGLPVGVG